MKEAIKIAKDYLVENLPTNVYFLEALEVNCYGSWKITFSFSEENVKNYQSIFINQLGELTKVEVSIDYC